MGCRPADHRGAVHRAVEVDQQVQPRGHAEEAGVGQALGERPDQPIAAQAVALAGGAQVAVVGAGLQERGEGELAER